jgi:hypothetical protein
MESRLAPWLDILEYAAEHTRRDLGVSSLAVSRFEPRAARMRTLVNVGVLGPGERRRPAEELYPFARYPTVARLFLRRAPYASTPETPGEPDCLALQTALKKTSQAGAPLIIGDVVWGELWTASTAGDLPLRLSELPLICWAAQRFAAGLGKLLADLRVPIL